MVKISRILLASTNCFRSNTVIPTENALSFQNNLNEHVISLERGDFKLSIGGLNNTFPYTVEGLLNILQSQQHPWCRKHGEKQGIHGETMVSPCFPCFPCYAKAWKSMGSMGILFRLHQQSMEFMGHDLLVI